jgi:carboxyl-terminal processing protease
MTSRTTLACVTAFCALVGTSAAAHRLPPQPVDAFAPTYVDDRYVHDVLGRWNLPGYGLLFDVGPAAVDVYNVAGPLCWRDDTLSSAGASPAIAWYAKSRHDMVFAAAPTDTQYHVNAAPRLPASCRSNVDRSTPLYVFDAIAQSLVRLYPFSAEYGVNWLSRYAQLRPRAAAARTERELRDVLARLLRDVNDPHVDVTGSVDGEAFVLTAQGKATRRHLRRLFEAQTEYTDFLQFVDDWQTTERAKALALARPETVKVAPGGYMAWGVLDGNVGYLTLGAMGGFEEGASAERERELAGIAIDQALTDLAGTRALVVDVVHNVGGLDLVSSEFASRFADRSRLAYTKRAHRAVNVQPQPFHVAPKGNTRYDKPVYLLAGDLTVSAGDIFVLLMRVLPNVTQVGEATVGALSDASVKTLPNGWTLSLSTEVYRDAQGRQFEAVGIPPQVAMPIYTPQNFADGYVDALRRTVDLATRP